MSNIVQDFKNRKGLWVKSFAQPTRQAAGFTRSGRTWSDIKQRCNAEGNYQKIKPTYRNCKLSDNFMDFQYFAEWSQSQIGHGLAGYNLDKDILVEGNKVYGEDYCVFVPSVLNAFFKSYDTPSVNPQGVYLMDSGNWLASIGSEVSGRKINLGTFKDVNDARNTYKIAKEAVACEWYNKLVAGVFIVDSRVTERMRTWEHICKWSPE